MAAGFSRLKKFWTRTGSRLKHFGTGAASEFEKVTPTRDEHWTGLGLDWIRATTNFVEFGLDPDCNSLQEIRIRTGFGLY